MTDTPRLEMELSFPWDPYDLPDAVAAIFAEWLRVAPSIAPTLADHSEPPRRPFDSSDLAREAMYLGWGWVAKRPEAKMRASAARGGPRNHSGIHIEVRGVDSAAEALLALADRLAVLLGADFGLVHVVTRSELAEAADQGRPDISAPHGLRGAALIVGSTTQLAAGLPSLYWRNYYGPPYTELIGQALRTAPWAALRDLGAGVVRADVQAEPPSETSYGAYAARRQEIQEYLGLDLFGYHARRVPATFRSFRAQSGPPSELAVRATSRTTPAR